MTHDATSAGLSRRQLLKRGAVVGAVAWTVPLIQVVGMSAAHADSPSAPPGGSAPQGSPPPVHQATPGAQQPGSTPIAFTGTQVPVGPAIGVGAAAVALGAGAVAAAQIRKNRGLSEADS